MKESWKWKQ